ncbi:hypothetical protein FIV34_04285 [Luteibacter pinisoli]|uniref:Bulb-type lectin domain-containing protein n=1 Tax=Luteibacter pinisoli TaxID=2589080 RepID=A0A4Y5Z1D3_9GAMM|nr:hypothetical protein [Luteibacter pinisoli]QDE38475.1 hypothetical protein FIV34_04285 [Luteibacter pinisoli]
MKVKQRMKCAFLAAGLALASGTTTAEVLGPGRSMLTGERLYASTKDYYATLEPDGDLVILHKDGRRIWSTGTHGRGAVKATMQRNGKFVLTTNTGRTVWQTPTRGRHRVFGVGVGGTAMVINARKWKPRDKAAEPHVEAMLARRARLEWQSPTLKVMVQQQREAEAQAAEQRARSERTRRRARP